jgi:hypothetical protein
MIPCVQSALQDLQSVIRSAYQANTVCATLLHFHCHAAMMRFKLYVYSVRSLQLCILVPLSAWSLILPV